MSKKYYTLKEIEDPKNILKKINDIIKLRESISITEI